MSIYICQLEHVKACESTLSVFPVVLHQKWHPKQLVQTPLSRYLCFFMGSQKQGEGRNASLLLQDGKRLNSGTEHCISST